MTGRLPAFALLLAFSLSWSAASADNEPATKQIAMAPDSSVLSEPSPITGLRATYQIAWERRQAGDFDRSASIADSAVAEIDRALKQDPDMALRRDLTELRFHLIGVGSASRHDLEAAAAPRVPDNEPDEKVLNTPASEGIEAQVNPDVLKWIEYFTGAGRSTFERWLKRSGRYVDLFRTVLQKEGLPPDLVHLVYVESGFNIKARSVSAAVGPWQFLRGTAQLFGLTVNQWVDERKDPEKSTVAAARYLKHLYAMFGDWPLALASYNAGEGTVLRAIKKQGTTNYWDLRLPRQTEDYVPQFMAVLAISREPRKYGFDAVELDDPMEFDEVALKGAIDLRALARLADCSVDELRDLNPAVLKHAATGRDGVTTLRVPRGKGEILLQRLAEGAQLPAVNLTLKHRVRRHETIQGIANQYHVSARRLALLNGIGKRRPLRRGMLLTVPAAVQAPSAANLVDGDPRASTAYVPSRSIAPRAMFDGKSAAEGRLTVTVRKGESLESIATRYNVSTADIMKWNRLKSAKVRRGTRLKIRTETEARSENDSRAEAAHKDTSATLAAAKPGNEPAIEIEKSPAEELRPAKKPHSRKSAGKVAWVKPGHIGPVIVVRRGDTLSSIALRHGVTIKALQRVNKLTSNQVRAGQRLRLPA